MKANTLERILADLVTFRTISGEHQAAAAFLDYADDYLAQRGMIMNRVEFNGFPSLVATTRPTKTPKLLLQAHIDVVSGPDSCFELCEKDGSFLGRGVFDMKFATAIFLKVVDELQDRLADYDFGIMLTSDEEVGGKDGVKALLDAGYGTDVCVLPDAGDNWQIETSYKGAWISHASTKGVAAHGSRPWEGDNAIDRLVDALCEIRELFDGQNTDSATLSINQISGGTVINQVADKAQATLDIRFVSNNNLERLKSGIGAIADRYDVSFETVVEMMITHTDITHPLVRSFLETASRIRGKPIGQIRSLGSSDARFFAARGIPVILVRPDGGCAHADDEWISKTGFEQYFQVVKAYVEKVAL
ncbi:MAG TPA: M20/M25/M40 family metallo-hydrolase [Candidatus Saccharimonadales bacterium]|nr:M20/M25/M40 family metallo-hydrolase [Candidatus Saccharimonadales bacterium]